MQLSQCLRSSGPSFIALLQIATTFALTAAPARAEDPGNTAAGRQLAETWCASCHVVDRAQKQATSNGAPPFAAIAAMNTTTFMGLRVFLQTPHGRMPDLHLSRQEINDVAAYIISLKR